MKNSELIKTLKNSVKPNKSAWVTEYALISNGEIITTNLNLFVCQKISIEGNFLIDTKNVLKICQKLDKDSDIEIKEEDKISLYVDGVAKFFFGKEDVKGFPEIPVTGDYLGNFKDAKNVKSCLNFVAKDELRPSMQCIEVGENIAATNGHILKFIKSNCPFEDSFLIPSFVVPFMQDVDYTMNKAKNDCGNYYQFHAGNHRVIFMVIDERFPNYMNVIPTPELSCTVDKKELIKQINLSLIVANKTTKRIAFDFNESVTLRSEDLDYNTEYKDTFQFIDSNINDLFTIGFNGDLMIKVLNTIEGDTVNFGMIAPNKGVLINGNNLIMPVVL
jgi:DNA polymerase III sliding clamp (beta) subunit (PCNA family)